MDEAASSHTVNGIKAFDLMRWRALGPRVKHVKHQDFPLCGEFHFACQRRDSLSRLQGCLRPVAESEQHIGRSRRPSPQMLQPRFVVDDDILAPFGEGVHEGPQYVVHVAVTARSFLPSHRQQVEARPLLECEPNLVLEMLLPRYALWQLFTRCGQILPDSPNGSPRFGSQLESEIG